VSIVESLTRRSIGTNRETPASPSSSSSSATGAVLFVTPFERNSYAFNNFVVLMTPLAIAAVGTTLVLITGGFDLSVAGNDQSFQCHRGHNHGEVSGRNLVDRAGRDRSRPVDRLGERTARRPCRSAIAGSDPGTFTHPDRHRAGRFCPHRAARFPSRSRWR